LKACDKAGKLPLSISIVENLIVALVLGEFPINLVERLPTISVSLVLINKFWALLT